MRALIVSVVLLFSAVAHAQDASEDFLEQRVTEELTADGILLSRLGVRLDIEAVGDQRIVSLVDDATGRVAASTKVDSLPADRDAAVASLTQTVATLASQLGATPPDAVPAPEPEDDAARREAEHTYRAYAIGFEDVVIATNGGTAGGIHVGSDWRAVQGEMRVPMSRLEFFREVGREDLIERRNDKIRHAKIFGGIATVGLVVTIAALATIPSDPCSYDMDLDAYSACLDDHDREVGQHALVSGVALVFTVGFGVAAVVSAMGADRLSEKEAKQLAEDHNRKLREKLGLPLSLDVSPYIRRDGAGLAVAGRF